MENLNFKSYGKGEPVIILHGLFGMLDNWKTFGRLLSEDYEVFLIDQRNHGNSPHADKHNYRAMAGDINEWMQAQDLSEAHLIGHSMGGKTAMTFALSYPEKTKSLISVDMGVKKYPRGHDKYFEAMRSLDIDAIESRSEADEHLRKLIPDKGIRLFIMKSIHRRKDGSYEWKFNLEQLYRDYPEILQALKSDKKYTGNTLFIGGTNSGYLKEGDLDEIRPMFPEARLEMIEAGHWIHVEKPQELLKIVRNFLGAN